MISGEWLAGHIGLQKPLQPGHMEKILALATDKKSSSLSRGDFVVAMYLINLLDREAGGDKGPQYLPNYLPEWLKEASDCLNSGGNAEAALSAAKATVDLPGSPSPPKPSTTSSPPIRKRRQNKQESEPLPSYSPYCVLMNPRQGDGAQRELYAQNAWVPAIPTDPPPRYSTIGDIQVSGAPARSAS